MLNARAMPWSIFGMLFIFLIPFTAFAQQEQQSGAALSQSQFERILEKIEESEDEMRAHVDKKFGELDEKFNKKFDTLDEKVDEIKTDVAVLNARLNLLQWVIAIIGAPFLISVVVLLVQMRLNQQNNAKRASEVVPESKEEPDADGIGRNLIDDRPRETEVG